MATQGLPPARGITVLKKRMAELDAFDPGSVTDQHHTPEVDALVSSIGDTLARVFGEGSPAHHRFINAASLDCGPYNIYQATPRHEFQATLRGSIQTSLAILRAAVKSLEEQIDDDADVHTPNLNSITQKVFVVHGHDDGARESVARFLEKMGLDAIILMEQPNMGRTIIEKFIDYADLVGFAVVLFTPDDLGGAAANETQSARARQNVVFELGYFVGSLGRGRACLLRKGEVELPSDLYGVVYTTMDKANGWKIELARELKAAGFKIDINRALA